MIGRRFFSAGGMRMANMVGSVGLAVLLAPTLGSADFGRYATLVASANLVAVLATLGLGRLALAELPKADADEAPTTAAVFLRRASSAVAISAPGAAAVVGVVTGIAVGSTVVGVLGGLLTLALTAVSFLSSANRALGRELLADATNGALGGAPGQLSAFALLAIMAASTELTLGTVLVVHTISVFAVAILLGAAARSRARFGVSLRTLPEVAMVRSALPYAVVQGMAILPIDLWIAAGTLDPATVGVYAVARRIAATAAIPLQVGNMATTRAISEHLARDLQRAQYVIRRTARLAAALALGPLVVVSVLAGPVIELAFGAEYSAARDVLWVLSIGVAVSVLTGPCGTVLAMSGRAGIVGRASVIAGVATLAAGLLLAEAMGAVGLAAAVSAATSLRFVYLALATKRQIGLWTLPVGGSATVHRGDVEPEAAVK